MECNTPLADRICCRCKGQGRRIQLTEPGDIRFASEYENQLLSGLLMEHFGTSPFDGRIILLNKVPGDDRSDEVIVDGIKAGLMWFDPVTKKHRFRPTADGAALLLETATENVVTIEDTGRHLSGKKVKPENTAGIPESPVLIRTETGLAGAGEWQESGILKIQDIKRSGAQLLPETPSMEDIIAANIDHIRRLGKDGMNIIRGIANQKQYRKMPVQVSFSGGKDSLVVLDLALSALKKRDVKAVFVNTGLEFPDTVEFVRKHCRERKVPLTEESAGNAFWENIDSFGPPGKDFRWCCKVCKLAPAAKAVENCSSSNGTCLTIDGKRRYESFSRSSTPASEMNPFVPGQLNIFPIRNWRAIEVWLYIHWRKLDYNPLYDTGFERVGCYLCPASMQAEYEIVKKKYPQMYQQWNSYLKNWATEHSLPEEYIDHGFWRWQSHPPKMLKLAEKLGIKTKPAERKGRFEIHSVSGTSPCTAGGYSVEANVTGLTFSEVEGVMYVMGSITSSEELGVIAVNTDEFSITYYSTGSLKVRAGSRESAEEIFNTTAANLARIRNCTLCGLCTKVCPADCISLDQGLRIDESCNACGRCLDSCVAARYR